MTSSPADQLSQPFATTTDVFLGGKLSLRQPKHGYRAGLDAIVLAATVPATFEGHIIDLGSGVGAVGLSAAVRCPSVHVTLIERDPNLADLARENAEANNVSDRVKVIVCDVTKPDADVARTLEKDAADIMLCNPPYHDDNTGTLATDALKAASHAMPEDALETWVRFACRLTKAKGRVTLIHRASALCNLLSALDRRFGETTVLPLHSRQGAPAHRIIVSGIKASRAPLNILEGKVIHADGHTFQPEFEAILRHGAALDGATGDEGQALKF
jgi:tRNA1(Val) A37 N6-methylase TrmN6